MKNKIFPKKVLLIGSFLILTTYLKKEHTHRPYLAKYEY